MSQNNTKLAPLGNKQIQTLMAMVTTTSDEEAWKLSPYSKSQFYRLKPLLEKYRNEFLTRCAEVTQDMLQILALRAVKELEKELDDQDVRIRNKASNDVLSRVNLAKDGLVTRTINFSEFVRSGIDNIPSVFAEKYGNQDEERAEIESGDTSQKTQVIDFASFVKDM